LDNAGTLHQEKEAHFQYLCIERRSNRKEKCHLHFRILPKCSPWRKPESLSTALNCEVIRLNRKKLPTICLRQTECMQAISAKNRSLDVFPLHFAFRNAVGNILFERSVASFFQDNWRLNTGQGHQGLEELDNNFVNNNVNLRGNPFEDDRVVFSERPRLMSDQAFRQGPVSIHSKPNCSTAGTKRSEAEPIS